MRLGPRSVSGVRPAPPAHATASRPALVTLATAPFTRSKMRCDYYPIGILSSQTFGMHQFEWDEIPRTRTTGWNHPRRSSLNNEHEPLRIAPMLDPTKEFRRHASECRRMASNTRDLDSKAAWNQMAERWLHCVKLAEVKAPERPAPRYRHEKTYYHKVS